MSVPKFVTKKGSMSITSTPYYIGLLQHERIMSKKQTYEYLAEKTGYKAAVIRAVFLALKAVMRENAGKAYITHLDGIATIRNGVKGKFATLAGPWVSGVNYLQTTGVAIEPFKNVLQGIIPINNVDGAKPTIDSVLDDTTLEYGVITGNHAFTIAGQDLGPDMNASDEYVALVSSSGTETHCSITSSTLGVVKCTQSSALAAGTYTLKVYTRSGMGEEYGVKCASRKVEIVTAA